MPDHPYIREYTQCPFCGADKPHRALACWPCFNARIKNGTDEETDFVLDEAEDEHRAANSQFGVGA